MTEKMLTGMSRIKSNVQLFSKARMMGQANVITAHCADKIFFHNRYLIFCRGLEIPILPMLSYPRCHERTVHWLFWNSQDIVVKRSQCYDSDIIKWLISETERDRF